MEPGHQERLESALYTEILDRFATGICVTDMETDRILFMNNKMKEIYGVKHPEGRACWQILQRGMTGRCEFCRKKELTERNKVCIWNQKNPISGRTYRNYDSLIEWKGRGYHIQNCVDVTKYQQLTEKAQIDELTNMLNRRAGKERMNETMLRAREEQVILTIVMYDIDELKRINDQYGHMEGDHLLRYVTDITKRCLGQQDFIFRLSGDEFILVFYNERMANAGKRIGTVLEQLKEERGENSIPYEVSFCYGMTEIYPGDPYNLADAIARADGQMYIQKRDYHIQRAREELRSSPIGTDSAEYFDYDRLHLYDALKDSTDDTIFIGNMKTGTFQYSPSMVKEFGLPGEVVENAAAFWGELIHPHDEKGFLESNQEVADGRVESHSIEYRARNVRGEWIWLRCRGRMIRDEQGNPALFAGFITNLGKRDQTDHMTGLYNRFEFEGAIKKYLMEKESVSRIGVMILNMDSFKNINDLYDRSFGDEILKITAQRIAAMLPGNAELYRLDGDEFGVVFKNGEEEDYLRLFHSIRHKFHRQQEYNGRKYYCTISAGYASYPKDADNYLDLFKYANYSLEYSKFMGKNRVTGFTCGITREKERSLELIELLRESIERGFTGFSVHYQPQVHSWTGELYGAEALARFHCSKYGDVSPGEFIPLLEQSGLIVPMGRWILEQAAAQCKRWCRRKQDFHMSVNLSYRQFQEGDIVADVRQVLELNRLSPLNFTLELTETYLNKEDAATHTIMEQLHKPGLLLAMDDFGVGYSSLFSLKSVPVDVVKIDRGFVHGISEDLFNATFIRAITELCHDVGKRVCLEGVETVEEYEAVKMIGLDTIQGYYFGRPVGKELFEERWFPVK